MNMGSPNRASSSVARRNDKGGYYKALNIISEYVQTELSAPEKGDTVPRTQKDHQER